VDIRLVLGVLTISSYRPPAPGGTAEFDAEVGQTATYPYSYCTLEVTRTHREDDAYE
jgi:hypothetical protein